MNQLKGTIYLRDNAWYKMENVIKMGIATFAKDRSNTYITGEVERGEYICVIEITLDKMKFIDKCLKHYFKSFHIYKGGGTEFYNRIIIRHTTKSVHSSGSREGNRTGIVIITKVCGQ